MQGKILGEHSFLKTSAANQAKAEYQKFMPDAPTPDYLSEAELYSVFFDKKQDILKENCLELDYKEGIVRLTDKETTEKQQSSTMEMIKKFGKSIFSSNVVGTSLPCVMFEPRSETDRLAEIWRLASYYMTKAGNITDKIERLKLVTTAEIACNYLALRKMKSFNPLLGETFECTMGDGSKISIEQVSHHPPVMCYYAEGPKKSYIHYGSEEYEGSFKGNYFVFSMKTKSVIRFRDGQEIVWSHRPVIKIGGLMFGDTYMVIKGSEVFYDKRNKLKVALFFDYGEKKGLFSSTKTVSKDKVEGVIYVPKEGVQSTGQEKRIADLNDIKTEVARIKGSWFESVTINDVNYWHIDKVMPLKIMLPKNPLPSDTRYREDLIWLRKGSIPNADSWKDSLEIRQRQDRKLREQFGNK